MGGRDHSFARPDRRAFALGLAGLGLIAPHWAIAQNAASPASKPGTFEPVPDSVLAASVDLSDRMTVPVVVNGRGPFPFVIDTGSNRSVLSDTLAGQLGLPAAGSVQVKAATGMARADSVRVASLAVGHRRMTDFQAPVLQVDNLGALGMLGIDAVSDQRLVMDFRKKQMTLTTTVRQELEAGTLVVQAKSRYGQLLLVDSEVEGIPLYVIIDTGSEITVGNQAMRTFLARKRAQRIDVVDVTGGTAAMDLGQLPELHVGKVVVRNEQVAYADLYVFEHLGLHGKPSMLLGMSTLRKCAKVSIDFPAREVRFLLQA
jgi:predicted aspartyl protease